MLASVINSGDLYSAWGTNIIDFGDFIYILILFNNQHIVDYFIQILYIILKIYNKNCRTILEQPRFIYIILNRYYFIID